MPSTPTLPGVLGRMTKAADEMDMCWRYVVHDPKDRSCWAIALLTEDGIFSVISDFGNYAFKWSHTGCKDFREFFVGLEPGYVQGKLGQGFKKEFQTEKTCQVIREQILQRRKEGELTKERAKNEMDLVKSLRNELDYYEWTQTTSLRHDHDWAVYDHPSDIQNFCKRVLPKIQKKVAADIGPKEESPEVTQAMAVASELLTKYGRS